MLGFSQKMWRWASSPSNGKRFHFLSFAGGKLISESGGNIRVLFRCGLMHGTFWMGLANCTFWIELYDMIGSLDWICYMLCTCISLDACTPWIEEEGKRTLRGAARLCRHGWHSAPTLGMEQALWMCVIPVATACMGLSLLLCVINTSMEQVTWPTISLPSRQIACPRHVLTPRLFSHCCGCAVQVLLQSVSGAQTTRPAQWAQKIWAGVSQVGHGGTTMDNSNASTATADDATSAAEETVVLPASSAPRGPPPPTPVQFHYAERSLSQHLSSDIANSLRTRGQSSMAILTVCDATIRHTGNVGFIKVLITKMEPIDAEHPFTLYTGDSAEDEDAEDAEHMEHMEPTAGTTTTDLGSGVTPPSPPSLTTAVTAEEANASLRAHLNEEELAALAALPSPNRPPRGPMHGSTRVSGTIDTRAGPNMQNNNASGSSSSRPPPGRTLTAVAKPQTESSANRKWGPYLSDAVADVMHPLQSFAPTPCWYSGDMGLVLYDLTQHHQLQGAAWDTFLGPRVPNQDRCNNTHDVPQMTAYLSDRKLEDSEYVATLEGSKPLRWHAIHSAGRGHDGILCLVREDLISSDNLRYHVVEPGRLLHVRILFTVRLDVLCIYQWAWNPGKAELNGKNRQEEMLRQRRHIWHRIAKWIESIPQRCTCLLAGDFNCSLLPEPALCGKGVVTTHGGHPDQDTFQELVRAHRCCALNTWSASGLLARTYVPPNATPQQGSQIDYILVRGTTTDPTAKKAQPFLTEFATMHWDPATSTSPALRDETKKGVEDWNFDALILAGWKRAVANQSSQKEAHRPAQQRDPDTLTAQVQTLWAQRAALRQAGRLLHVWSRRGPSLRHSFQVWACAARLQAHTRALRKACRHKKTEKVAEAVQATNIHQAAKRFAPKMPKRRIQLRREHGGLQTHEAEFRQIVQHFTSLYHAADMEPPQLSADLCIEGVEIDSALCRLQPGKAMPSCNAPAALWKRFRQDLVPLLQRQFAWHLRPGVSNLPEAWTLCELVLLPKPGKPLKSPAHLRPISLLAPEAKILASIVAQRLKEPAKAYLASLPQFAYVEGRTLQQALERVLGHCAQVRGLVQGNTRNIHNKRSGRTSLSLYGGCQLSLDLTSAYDLVQWPLLRLALVDAAIPEPLIQLIMLVHHSAKLALQHCGLQQTVSLKRGLRQGCSLSPTLWAIFSGWMLKRMHDPQLLNVYETNTSYADDQRYRWTIREGKDLEAAYAGMKHVLACLLSVGMIISQDKTVVILEVQGTQAARALARYTVERPQGKCFRFVIADQTLYLKIVPKHVYLGAVVGFRHFEQDTFKHRLSLARCTFSRLGVILRNRGVPLRLRLQLWQGCIWPALFHALDCTGLPQKELQTLQTQLIKQARAIAKSHSMLTKETNHDFIRRLRLPDPVQRLQQALMQRVALDETLSPVLAPGPGQLQWRAIVRGHLFDGRNEWTLPDTIVSAPTTTPAARLEEVQEVLSEIFKCDDCGQEFATQAALRRHVFLTHLSQQQQQDRTEEVKESIKGAEMAHALDGMPKCKHCLHAFSTWHAFHYHINSKSCAALRALSQNPEAQASILPEITEALIALCTAMFDNMLMRPEQSIPSELTAATHELSLLRNLVNQQAGMGAIGSLESQERRPMEWHMEADPEDKDVPSRRDKPEGRQPKWHKPDQKGGQKGGQKGKGRNPLFGPASRSNNSWRNNGNPQASSGNHSWQADGDKTELSRAELQEIKNVLNMVSTLVIRQEVQQNIQRQDTGFMVFVQTQVPDNLAQSMFQIGKTWHDTKRDNPTALRHPMRVTLYQHFVQTIKERFQAMMRTPSSRSKAESLGWVSSCGRKVHGLKWDTTQQAHVQDETIASLEVVEIEEALDELLTCAPQQLVIQRFHATRQLAAEYQSPVITMFLEVGMRTDAAQSTWRMLHLLERSAVWASGGCFLRHERLQMSALAKRLSTYIDTVKCVRLGNKHCFCYANALMMSLLCIDCSMEGPSLFSGVAARVVDAILQSAGQIFHLWEQGEWISMMEWWVQPTRQHDVAEFLAFLTKCPYINFDKVALSWQARSAAVAGDYLIQDLGYSVPLTLVPPCDVGLDNGDTYTVQDLVQAWHNQDEVFAAWPPPSAIILQLSR
ncbi:Pol [Symbiodinium sp. CCMP2592]|nr:Pol [Symbiodinium sp. CCMP2592]